MEIENRLKKIGTLGGQITFNQKTKGFYFGDNGPGGAFSKEKLFGANGPLHPGMPYEHELALGAVHSDTRQTLIRELVDQTHLTREEAERTVEALLRKGILEEISDAHLGKVLVFKEGR